MSNSISSDEMEILRQAAEVATSVLPRLEKERAEIDKHIANLRSLLSTWESLTGDMTETTSSVPEIQPQRAPKGEINRYIDSILGDGIGYREPEIRATIAQRFGAEYGRSTSYAALRRGEREGKYIKDGELWRLKRFEPTIDDGEDDQKQERREGDDQIALAPFFLAGVAEQE